MGRLPFDQIDLLVVGELGKNYSGAGMDPNVIGRLFVETQRDFDRPVVTRLVVLDVSDESHGNIVGVGFADLTTDRLVSRMDEQSFRINTLTSCCLQRSRIPLSLPTDHAAIEAGLETCWRIDPNQARVVVIPNTLELQNLWVSQSLDDEVGAILTSPGLVTFSRCLSSMTDHLTSANCFRTASADCRPRPGFTQKHEPLDRRSRIPSVSQPWS